MRTALPAMPALVALESAPACQAPSEHPPARRAFRFSCAVLGSRSSFVGQSMPRPRAIDIKLAALREQREHEQRDRTLAVIAEFGGQKPERMLVPEDDPANNELVMRLVDEVLFLRDQIQRIGKAMELVQAGKPFAIMQPGPHGQSDDTRGGSSHDCKCCFRDNIYGKLPPCRKGTAGSSAQSSAP
jgi:hypothetical protein